MFLGTPRKGDNLTRNYLNHIVVSLVVLAAAWFCLCCADYYQENQLENHQRGKFMGWHSVAWPGVAEHLTSSEVWRSRVTFQLTRTTT